MPSRRHCRQTGPIYLAKLLSPYLFSLRCGLRPWQGFVPLTNRSLTVAAPIRAERVSKRISQLHSALLGRTAPVVRDGRHILDGADFNTGGAQRANRRFAARTGAGNAHFHHPQPAFVRLVGRRHGRLLGGEGRALARSAKAERTGAGPGNRVAFLIADGHDGVVEGGLDMLGPVTLSRAYYHCTDCSQSVVPKDDELGVAGTSLSPGLRAMVARVGAASPFAKASELLATLAGVQLTTKRVERSAEADGQALVAIGDPEAAAVLTRPLRPGPRRPACGPSPPLRARDPPRPRHTGREALRRDGRHRRPDRAGRRR